ncbi:hypothetical protein BpHYR1_021239 [Brachionus plicatilis]|uniref:Uncharacterized protein n=1 Tax=Brachionus plicatilis TaxID=10195 RepID=A0A3M7T564_BRAPC|nr:hypothetical protein BpHYR1_021239 [Brachionus plicatilis]
MLSRVVVKKTMTKIMPIITLEAEKPREMKSRMVGYLLRNTDVEELKNYIAYLFCIKLNLKKFHQINHDQNIIF